MSQKLLTVAIPTYGRAQKLDRQLAWLDRNLRDLEDVCDVIVSDNASPDDTRAVCQTWSERLAERGVKMHINRMPCNVGPLPNIARCIELSSSRFTWVIGDDDEIPDEKLAWIVARLQVDPDLVAVVLNFRSVGRTQYEQCFHFDADQLGAGHEVIEKCLRQAYFGLAFMTAQIYRTEYAQAALRVWPEGTRNYDFQIFITAYVAARGGVLATRDTHVTYVTGDNIYERDHRIGLRLYADSLEVFLRLQQIGYPAELCRWLARHHLWALKKRFAKCTLANNPLLTGSTLLRAVKYLAQLSMTRLQLRDPHRVLRLSP